MFQTDISWSDDDRSLFLAELFGQPGLRAYSCIEISANFRIFHVDVFLRDQEDPHVICSRFLFYDIATVLGFLCDEQVIGSKIGMQSVSDLTSPYTIVPISQIFSASDDSGNVCYFLVGENHEEYAYVSKDGMDGASLNRSLVWRAM